jgi:hypothetical protein
VVIGDDATARRLRIAGWAIVAAYAAWSFGGQQALAAVLDPFSRNLVEQSLLTAFFLVHAAGGLRAKEFAAYALICFVISNLLENLSVTTGFPFGAFHHSEATGPRLFNIPWLATPTYIRGLAADSGADPRAVRALAVAPFAAVAVARRAAHRMVAPGGSHVRGRRRVRCLAQRERPRDPGHVAQWRCMAERRSLRVDDAGDRVHDGLRRAASVAATCAWRLGAPDRNPLVA